MVSNFHIISAFVQPDVLTYWITKLESVPQQSFHVRFSHLDILNRDEQLNIIKQNYECNVNKDTFE
jgi:hypothetical protein